MPKSVSGLFAVFVPLSFCTIGGGQAILAEVERQVVTVQHWLTKAEFVEVFAVSRMAPGPGSLYITLIGWKVAGIAGAAAATIAIFFPPLLLTYVVARHWSPHSKVRWQLALEAGLRPVVTGMVLASVYVLLVNLNGGWWARSIAVVSTLTLILTRANPILMLATGATIYVGIHHLVPS